MHNLLQTIQLHIFRLVAATGSGQSYGSGGYNTQTYGGKSFKLAGTNFHFSFGWLLLIISLLILLCGIAIILVARKREQKTDNNQDPKPTVFTPQ